MGATLAGVTGQIPGGTRTAGAGACLCSSLGFGCSAGSHADIGGAQNPFQILAAAFGTFHFDILVITAHHKDFHIFLTFDAFKFENWHSNSLGRQCSLSL
jgi:hypothetical protein